jgi:hypothetical protein
MQCKLSPPIKSIRRKAPGTEDDRSRDRGAGLRGGGDSPWGRPREAGRTREYARAAGAY